MDITDLFLQNLNKHPNEIKDIEASLRFALSVIGFRNGTPYLSRERTREEALELTMGALRRAEVGEEDKTWNDSDDGLQQVISDFQADLINSLIGQVDRRSIAEQIVSQIFVEGKEDYRFDPYVLKELRR